MTLKLMIGRDGISIEVNDNHVAVNAQFQFATHKLYSVKKSIISNLWYAEACPISTAKTSS